MSEFVVGQWVECVEPGDFGGVVLAAGFHRVKDAGDDSPDIHVEGLGLSWNKRRFRPVSWQVGRTYRTTLEGVTATISEIDGKIVRGLRSDTSRKSLHAWWNGAGEYCGYSLESKYVPHLTPYLVDEPSPAVEATEPSKLDPINPPHYQQHPSGVECITVTEHLNFCIGNAVKYLWRAGLKGDALTDLRKAAWYVEREIQRVEKMKGGDS